VFHGGHSSALTPGSKMEMVMAGEIGATAREKAYRRRDEEAKRSSCFSWVLARNA